MDENEFSVSVPYHYIYNSFEGDQEYYQVDLPHQCDEWIVACDETRAGAIAQLEEFLTNGAKALEQLKTMEAGYTEDHRTQE